MDILKIIFKHEWLLLTRNKLQLIVLLIFTCAALYGIYYGKSEISKQELIIEHIRNQSVLDQAKLLKGLDADTSNAAGIAAYEAAAYPSKVRFFLNFYAINLPSPFANLSIGQRDIYPYYLQLNAQNLYLQLFRSEISNPRKLLAGNFDLGFVIIYLMPLLIIAFTYNQLSIETEQGTFAMLKTSPVLMHVVILYKSLFYFVIITSIVCLISIIAFIWCSVSLTVYGSMLWWLFASILYTACWFGLILLIGSFNNKSAFNAMWSLGLWLLFLIIIPSVLNLFVTDNNQVDSTKLTDAIRRQQGMSETAADMKAIVNKFYKTFPEYRSDSTSTHDFLTFKAYSAFVTYRDMSAKPTVDAYFKSIRDRNNLIRRFDIISPAVNMQNILNAVGNTDVENSFDFTHSIIQFHRQLSRFTFVPLFSDRLMTKQDFKNIPVFQFITQHKNIHRILSGLLWLTFLLLASVFISIYKLSRI